MHDVDGQRALVSKPLCICALAEIRILETQKDDHIQQYLAAYERHRDTLLVSVKLEDRGDAADHEQYPEDQS